MVFEQLVQRERTPTKLQQTLNCQLHVVPAIHCNLAFTKGNAQAKTELVGKDRLVLFQKLHVEVKGKFVSWGLAEMSVGVIRIQTVIFEHLTSFPCYSQLLGFLIRHRWRSKGVVLVCGKWKCWQVAIVHTRSVRSQTMLQ